MRAPAETHQAMTRALEAGLKQVFPVAAGNRMLDLVAVHAPDLPDPHDWNGQKDAVMDGRTWGSPLRATLALKDAQGKVLDQKAVRLATIPAPTNRHTFIVDGREYQVNYQRRLKPGIYTKVDRTGAPVADFNLGHGRNFAVTLDPERNQFHLRLGNAHIPLGHVLAGLRESGDPSLGLGKAFEHPAGPEETERALREFYVQTHRNKPIPADLAGLKAAVRTWFDHATLSPETTRLTVGESYGHVTDQALRTAARHVLEIHRGDRHPTHKDQLAYQEIHGVEDFLKERLVKNKLGLHGRLRQTLDRADKLADLNLPATFGPSVHHFFTQSSLSNHPMQVNPLEMAENAHKITSMGEGGIGDANAIPIEVRNIHPSTLGFIDPVRTPDNAHAGVDVRTTVRSRKVGNQLAIPVRDARTGREVFKTPGELFDTHVAHDREPAENGVVRAIHQGHVVWAKPEQIDYHLPTEHQFTVSTALVPFIPNSHAHRVAMGAKMLGQAVSLDDREAPIVRTAHANTAISGLLPRSPVDGTVATIVNGAIKIQDKDGKSHLAHYPHEFPLNGGSFLHADLHVKPGDRVSQGQVLGDLNFTRDGNLALGKNLTVAYLPYRGHNFEDGLVVTEQGARKLTSSHLHTEVALKDGRNVYDLKQFKGHFPSTYTHEQLGKLDPHGVVRVGQEVVEGDPLVAGLRKRVVDPEQLILGKAHKGLMEPYRDASLTWDKPYAGKITAVSKTGDQIKVTIQAKAPLQLADKISNLYGAKGVVTTIIPDHEAPRTASGEIPDVIQNSAGLISRMNNGQLYHLTAAKAVKALGLDHMVFPQFLGQDAHEVVSRLAEKAGIAPEEELFDPKTNRSLGKVMIGPQYMLKLFKQAETGFSARAGGRYDVDLRPAKGGEEGAKSIGYLDVFGLLSHGSRGLLRQAATTNAEFNPEVLQAIWRGQPLPPPRPTFAWRKFEAMLRGAGVNVTQDGHKLVMLPMTDQDTLRVSQGQIRKPLLVNAKEDPRTGLPFRPETGGLFDHESTGGLVGNKWSHITLPEPVVSPLFARPARILLGMSQQAFGETMATEGGAGIAKRLAGIDPKTRIAELGERLKTTSAAAKRDQIHKQLKYLKPLAAHGISPADAYVVRHVPVIPPAMRPIYPDADTGKLVNSDANLLYQHLLLIGDQLAHHQHEGDPDTVRELRLGLHDALAKVQGLDPTTESMGKGYEPQGFLKLITGSRAKEGFFQSKLLSRRQDIAGRGVITPNPALGIDELGLPEPMAWKLYRNHVVGELTRAGLPLESIAKHVEEQTPLARKALQATMADNPVIMTRAPSLHRFNLMAFKPQLTSGKHIEVPNLVVKGFNADFDGDAVNVHIPITPEAKADAWRVLPSKNLFSTLNKSPMHTPSQEVTMGLWKLGQPNGKATRTFKSRAEAIAAYKKGDIGIADPIEIG